MWNYDVLPRNSIDSSPKLIMTLVCFCWINTWRLWTWTNFSKTTESSTFHVKSHPIHSSAVPGKKSPPNLDHASTNTTGPSNLWYGSVEDMQTFGETPPQLISFGTLHLSPTLFFYNMEMTPKWNPSSSSYDFWTFAPQVTQLIILIIPQLTKWRKYRLDCTQAWSQKQAEAR